MTEQKTEKKQHTTYTPQMKPGARERLNKRVPYTPIPGFFYRNRNGQLFKCISSSGNYGVMRNVKTGWQFEAYGIAKYPNDDIDWDFSLSGRFVEESARIEPSLTDLKEATC